MLRRFAGTIRTQDINWYDTKVSNIYLALSFRRIIETYEGDCFRLRRLSDNAETDIGFYSNGEVNEDDITTFLGASQGGIAVWYNQIGGNNAIPVNTGSLPLITDASGNIYKLGTKVAINNGGGVRSFRVGALGDFNFLHNGVQNDNATVVFSGQIGFSDNPNASISICGTNSGTTTQIGSLFGYDDRSSIPRNNQLFCFNTNGTSGALFQTRADNILTPNVANTCAAAIDGFAPIMRVKSPQGSSESTTYEGGYSPTSSNHTNIMEIMGNGNGNGGFIGYFAELIIGRDYQPDTDDAIQNEKINYFNI